VIPERILANDVVAANHTDEDLQELTDRLCNEFGLTIRSFCIGYLQAEDEAEQKREGNSRHK